MTQLPFPIMFELSNAECQQLHCCYEHSIRDDNNTLTLIWIGVTRLSEVMMCADAKRNSEWIKFVTPERPVMTTIKFVGTFHECSNYRAKEALAKRPHCNARGYDFSTSLRIRCIEDGIIYNTISDAARAYGAAQPALSAHINGKPGHKTVKGRTFERVAHEAGMYAGTTPAPLQPQPQAPVVPTMTQSPQPMTQSPQPMTQSPQPMTQSPQPMTREEIERKIKEIYAGPPSDEAMEQIRQLNNMLGENQ